MNITKHNSDLSIIVATYVFIQAIHFLVRGTRRHQLHQQTTTVHKLLSRTQIEANQCLYFNLSDNEHSIERQLCNLKDFILMMPCHFLFSEDEQ